LKSNTPELQWLMWVRFPRSSSPNLKHMTKIYFEKEGYAEHIATFKSEELLSKFVPALEKLALDNGFDKLTQSVGKEYLTDAAYYLSNSDVYETIEEQVDAIADHPNQNDLIDNVRGVAPWEPLERRYSCIEFLDLIGY